MDRLKIDPELITGILIKFLRDKLAKSHLTGYVIGLSGGIDSSLSATIAVKAVGREKVYGVLMPYATSSETSISDAGKLAEQLGIITDLIDISPMVKAFYPEPASITPVRLGNKMARERMSILFDKAFELNQLVLGTSNRTEICLGYGTWYGDVACSVNPIGMLYKTQVRQLAKYLGVPESILTKAPTADLWPGQTDETELGLDYDRADRLLYALIEEGINRRSELNSLGFDDQFIDRAVSLLNRFYFKRHLPELADLNLKPIPDKIEIN
ncbi:MAG: NAD+ synthase [Candidatus Zixiibacteriota bacterium]